MLRYMGLNRAFLLAGLATALAVSANAQTLRYPVWSLDFDIWCTEEQHIAADRCDKRLPEDVEKFDAYRHIVERYQIPYLQEKDQELRFDQDILRNDPIDKQPDSHNAQPPQPTDGR
jgi:hypothetical protein